MVVSTPLKNMNVSWDHYSLGINSYCGPFPGSLRLAPVSCWWNIISGSISETIAGWWLTYPSENMKVSWDHYSQYMGEKKHVPNHQPVICLGSRISVVKRKGILKSAFPWVLIQPIPSSGIAICITLGNMMDHEPLGSGHPIIQRNIDLDKPYLVDGLATPLKIGVRQLGSFFPTYGKS